MAISVSANSVVANGGQQVALSSLFTVTAASSNPTYLIVDGLDRDEYTAGYSTSAMGTLTGNGASQSFKDVDGDAYSVGAVFTYQASTGRYYSTTYGYFDQLTYKTSTSTNDNVSLSVFTTNNANVLNLANNPYTLIQDTSLFNYVGSVSVVTQPTAVASALTQATPNSVCSAAASFVGKAWNIDGCWVLASNIAAEAGASLPLTSSLIDIPGVANSEWIVAYNGPSSSSSNWQQLVHAGEIIALAPTANSGHITTCVSGSGSTAMLVDNIEYINNNGSIANAANDGSASDIIVAVAHAASQEFANAAANSVVIYELDTPVVTDVVSSVTIAAKASEALTSLFTVANPLASQSVTEYQVYDKAGGDSFSLNGITETATSAAAALSIASLTGLSLTAGATAGSDTLEVRAYNGSYWGDWQSLGVTVTGAAAAAAKAPTVTAQTAGQTWLQGAHVSFTLAANTFTDPQGQALTLSAALASGAALPIWLTFNATTNTFTGVVPAGMEALSLKVTATDTSGLTASETFGVTVPAAAPTVTVATANQTWQQGQKISDTLAANTFTDPQGETLTYSATQAGGAALPSWLTFNATTDTFSGTVPTTGAQNLSFKVTATDTSGLSASETFGVTVSAAVPIVTGQTASQIWQQGQHVSFALAANTFTDPQGQTLTLSAALASGAALPSWLTFNAATKTFTGVVPAGMEALSLKVTATDTSGLTASETFGVTVPAAAPTVTAVTASQTWQQGQNVSDTLAVNTFTDPQGETLTYSATQVGGAALPNWLTFNATTDTFSGTVPTTGAQNLSFKVTATDSSGLSASETFGVIIPNRAPVVTNQTPTLTWTDGTAISVTLPAGTFTDPQGEKLTYTAYQLMTLGSTLATSWLRFNATTDTFSGTVPGNAAGSLTLEVVATNTSGLSATDVFNVNYKTAAGKLTTAVVGEMSFAAIQQASSVALASSLSH